jgi:PAS domain S-box-containing protein
MRTRDFLEMNKTRIIIAEDKEVIADDLALNLRETGYEVILVTDVDDAVRMAKENKPDLVVMDTILRGKIDGIKAGEFIQSQLGIPVIYLSTGAESKSLELTKTIEPSAHLKKAINAADVQSAIEARLYKNRFDEKLRENLEWLFVTLNGIAVGLISADSEGRIIFMNESAQLLTGYTESEARNRSLADILDISQGDKDSSEKGVVEKLLTHNKEVTSRFGPCALESRNGTITMVDICSAPIRDMRGKPAGLILVFHDITNLKKTEEALRASHEALASYSSTLETKVKERTGELEQSRSELKIYSESLEKTNEALRIIVEGVEEQKREIEIKITQNLNLTVKPVLEQLKSQQLPDTAAFLLQSLEFSLGNVFSSFGLNIVKDALLLTPKEMRICEMIRSGLSSKQIAKVLNISPQTVLVHRKNIRKKLSLSKSRSNLTSFLKANF